MDLLIHATLTVTGAAAQLTECDARIKALLMEKVFDGGFEEHHGDAALSYDFKVRGGIPFPAFAVASQEFPGLTIIAEWVNVSAGRKGRAQIANGEITQHAEEPIALASTDTPNRYLRAAADGTLELAVALVQTDMQAWAGYVLNHQRDALFRVTRAGAAIELVATEGAPDWVQRWQLVQAGDTPAVTAITPPERVNKKLYTELEDLAQGFVADWIWFRDAPPERNAIDMDRFSRYGFTVHDANVRAARLYALQQETGIGKPLQHTTVDPASAWIIAMLSRCWARV